MRIAVVTNMNGIGLQRDFELLRDFLAELGHEVHGFQYDGTEEVTEKFNLAIFLEVTPRNLLNLAPIKWAFLNPEWCKPEVIKVVTNHIDRVFAKTEEAFRILGEVFPGKTYLTGFLTRDQFDESVVRDKMFLHIGGNSQIRGTQAVIDAWKWEKDGKTLADFGAHLAIVSTAVTGIDPIPGVAMFERLPEAELKSLQNSCKFHLYPSGTEGWGHAFHEALSVGAIILTTDAPPMNEMDPVYQIPAVSSRKYNLADVYEVSALDIFNGVQDLLSMYGNGAVSFYGSGSRETFLADNERFRAIFSAQLPMIEKKTAPAVRAKNAGIQIAFLGNFSASESTENMIKWALEEGLCHEVLPLQENEVNLSAIRSAMDETDLFLWVRTPGWLQVPDRQMIGCLMESEHPTLSIHLDKFWGIPEREALIGEHPFWKTDHVWTADGSMQKEFAEREVNHHWMRPAVSEVYCHPGQPWDMYRCDVGFVGAKDYHSEYPFRRQLVEWLEKTYGDRFKHITGLRGHGLNDFYASCKVVVGDCIFAGTPFYWSDRVPETVGRHGFLVHPYIEGLSNTLCMFYTPQNLEDLQIVIERSLNYVEIGRKNFTRHAAEEIRKKHTWTVRMREILSEVL